MARYGYIVNSHTKSIGASMVEGSYSYDSVSKPIVFGRNQIVLDGKAYGFASTQANGTLEFRANDTDKVLMPSLLTDSAVAFSQSNLVSSVTGTLSQTVTIDNSSWSAFFGVLTDKVDANPPSDNKMQYKGSISFVGGNGAPFPGSMFLNVVSTFCPITLNFDAATGTLSTVTTSCTDSRGTHLDFSLKDLTIKNSRVFASVGDEAQGAASGPSSSGDASTGTVPTVALSFTSSKIGGAVFGKNAQYVGIQGSGASGLFSVTAFRQ